MKQEIMLINGELYLIKKIKLETKTKILKLLKNKKKNISEINRELGMAYNNTFRNIKELKEMGYVKLTKSRTQNNPTIVELDLIKAVVGGKVKSGMSEVKRAKIKW